MFLLIPVIIGVSFIVYFIMDIAPGKAEYMIVSEEATQEEIDQIRSDLGLDQPLLVRYGRYMSDLVRGDLGVSYISKRDVFQTYIARLPATIRLSFVSMGIAILIPIPLGIMCGVNKNHTG